MQRKHGAGDAGVSLLEGAVFESWFEGGTPSSSRPQGWGSPGQWPHNQETRAGYWEPRLVRRRQFANKSCQAEEVSCSCTRAARS